MDIPGSGPYTHGNPEHISRPDVWRLLHLPQIEDDELLFGRRPQTPWEPWGSCLPKDCALRVTTHLRCARHEHQYHHWNWGLEKGSVIHDQGFSIEPPSTVTEYPSDMIGIREHRRFPTRELDQEPSEEATLYAFLWLSINEESKPSETIYEDAWLEGIWEEDEYDWEEDEADDQASKVPVDQVEDRVKAWLNSIG